jgi:hypothetical protein
MWMLQWYQILPIELWLSFVNRSFEDLQIL